MKSFLVAFFLLCSPCASYALDFGDSSTKFLLQQSWSALAAKDYPSVMAYTKRIVDLYASKAKEMQASLTEYPKGSNDDVFKFWALNDVGTALFIQAEAYRLSGKKEESLAVYQQIINDYSFAQCWDTHGWFWKIADVAQDKIDIANSGMNVDFGDYNSNKLVQKAWKALEDNKPKNVRLYVRKVVQLYGDQAKDMQKSLDQNPKGGWKYRQKAFDLWALNDVGTALFILGEAYYRAGQKEEASKIYDLIIHNYSGSACWDVRGWFWRPEEVARKRLEELQGS